MFLSFAKHQRPEDKDKEGSKDKKKEARQRNPSPSPAPSLRGRTEASYAETEMAYTSYMPASKAQRAPHTKTTKF